MWWTVNGKRNVPENVAGAGFGKPSHTHSGVNVLPGITAIVWPSGGSITWIVPLKLPDMMTSSWASVRFVASLLTTTQKLPLIVPPKVVRLISLEPTATTAQRGSIFTRMPAVANAALAYACRPSGHSGDPRRAEPSSEEVA